MELNEIEKHNSKDIRSNKEQYSLDIQGFSSININVLYFKLLDNFLSSDFELIINAQSDDVININELLGLNAVFKLHRPCGDEYIAGVISSIGLGSDKNGLNGFVFTINSILNRLKKESGSYVYLNKDAKSLASDIMLRSGLNEKNFYFKLKEKYSNREFVLQYNESDYDFLSRVISYYGIFYSFEHSDGDSKVVFYDGFEDFPILQSSGGLIYNAESGAVKNVESIFCISSSINLLTESFKLKDYNYRIPEISIESSSINSSELGACGEQYLYGLNAYDIESNDKLCQVINESIDWKRMVLHAESDCRGLFPGCRFELKEHPESTYNVEYFVVAVSHYGDQSSAFSMNDSSSKSTYRNKLVLLPQGTHYRSDFIPKPKINGVITAIVESSGGDYAHIDEQGRYKIKLSFDLQNTNQGESSHPIRLMQQNSGSNHGIHFPLHSGTEVVVSCVNGDPDRPILLGSLPNPNNNSPTSSQNNTQNIIRTWGGNELQMEDIKKSQQISLFTKCKNNLLNLDAAESKNKIELTSQLGEMELFSSKVLLIESGDSQTYQSGNNHFVTIENKQQLMTRNKQIEINAATDIQYKAGVNILMESEKENIEVATGKNLVMDVESNMSIDVHSKNIEFKVSNGNIDISAAKSITVKGQGGGDIHVGQSGSSIEISVNGDLTINAKIININGSSINMTGNSVSNN